MSSRVDRERRSSGMVRGLGAGGEGPRNLRFETNLRSLLLAPCQIQSATRHSEVPTSRWTSLIPSIIRHSEVPRRPSLRSGSARDDKVCSLEKERKWKFRLCGLPVRRQVIPLRILRANKSDLLRTRPGFDLLFPSDGITHLSERFDVDQMGHVVLLRESLNNLVAMFTDPAYQITGDAHAKRSPPTRHDVDVVGVHRHRCQCGAGSSISSQLQSKAPHVIPRARSARGTSECPVRDESQL